MNLTTYIDRLRASFWFIPAVMAVGAVLLALGIVTIDEIITGRGIVVKNWAYSGGAEGASAVLGTIAGSMITIAGVVFSLTLVALSLTASQLGPRVLNSFMRDRAVQMVLGTFIATYLYCLMVLRTVRRVEEVAFVPQISVTLALLLAVMSLAVLIYFIHHVAVSIQADEIIGRVSNDLRHTIPKMFPLGMGLDGPAAGTNPVAAGMPESFEVDARQVPSKHDGYIQYVSSDSLIELAARRGMLFRLLHRPGDYVVRGARLADAWPPQTLNEDVIEELNSAFVMAGRRSPAQDIEFSVYQLVEIAVRALSPGINDPFTAVTCVDRLGSALCQVARMTPPSPYRLDDGGVLRIVVEPLSFESLTNAALNQIRQSARPVVAVTIRLLEMITMVAGCVSRDDEKAALRRQADMIVRGARETISEELDLADVEERYAEAVTALAARSSTRS